MNLQDILSSPSVRDKTKEILKLVDSMDIVDAIKDIEMVRLYLKQKKG